METILWYHNLAETKHFIIQWVDIDFGNGKQAQFEMIAFNNTQDQPQGGVIICGYSQQTKEVVMIKQFQVALWKQTFLLPRWGNMKGKTVLETAQQEFLEETWYEAEQWIELPMIYSSPWFFSQYTTIFLALWIRLSDNTAEWDEETIAIKILLSKAIEMIMNGEIVDARTISAIFIAKQYIENML